MIFSLLSLSFSISSLSDRGIEDHANVSMLHGMPQVKVNKKVKREGGREGVELPLLKDFLLFSPFSL